MDDIRGPAQFLHGFQHAAGKEDGALSIVCEELAFLVAVYLLAAEIIFVIDEVYLDAGGRYGCDLDDEGAVYVRDDDVHAGEADDLVQLILSLVDAAVAGHEGTDFLLALLNALRELTAYLGNPGFRKVGVHLGVDEQNLLGGISHNSYLQLTHKVTKNF